MTMCMKSKSECATCNRNINGYCDLVKKNVDDIIKKWKSSNKSKAKRKLKENEQFFKEETINKIIKQANIIQNSKLKSKEQIDAMNEINAIFYHWKTIRTKDLFN